MTYYKTWDGRLIEFNYFNMSREDQIAVMAIQAGGGKPHTPSVGELLNKALIDTLKR